MEKMHPAPRHRARCCLALLTTLAVCALPFGAAQAAQGDSVDRTTGEITGRIQGGLAADADAPMEANAEQLEYDRDAGRVTGSGNVVIRKGGTLLQADNVVINMETSDAVAIGHVKLTRGSDVLTADRLKYNFKSGHVELEGGDVEAAPFRVRAATTQRDGDGVFTVTDAVVTTCKNARGHQHYRMVARSMKINPDNYIIGKHVKVYARNVPVFYLPYWYHSPEEAYGFHFTPGYSSRMGAFLLSSYRHPVGKLVLEHHLDYRTQRGVALGEDVSWKAPGGGGELMLYYADDQEPLADGEDPLVERVTSERYRIRLGHTQTTGPRSYLALQGTYLSDTDVEEDFFRRAYRASAQPDNYVTWLLRDDDYTFSLEARTRLNDYYDNLARLPEGRLTVMRRPFADGNLYYEGGSSLGFLRQDFAYDEQESYSSARLDWYNRVYYPQKVAGWLNVNPNAGYRLTWYSATADTVDRTTGIDTNGNSIVEQVVVDGPAELRSVLDLAMDVSFKAFKYLDPDRIQRHVIEPYATWGLVLDPTVEPVDLYQFDSIDAITGSHGVKLGLRNKLQRKWRGEPVTTIDADVFTYVNFDPDEGRDSLESLGWDLRFLPVMLLPEQVTLQAYLDGIFDMNEGAIGSSNERLQLTALRRYQVELEHRYLYEQSNLLIGSAEVHLSERWDVGAFVRYEIDDSQLEEQGLFVQQNLDCLSSRLGFHHWPTYTRSDGVEEEGEFQLLLEIWLRDFPEYRMKAHGGY